MLSLPTCSLAKTGARESKPRTQKPALVGLVSLPALCSVSYLSKSGEVGKLLGAKWKEMDEEEKKVGFSLLR